MEPKSLALQADSLLSEPPGKPKNTGVGSLFLLQGNFLTQESNRGLLHCQPFVGYIHMGPPSFVPKRLGLQPSDKDPMPYLGEVEVGACFGVLGYSGQGNKLSKLETPPFLSTWNFLLKNIIFIFGCAGSSLLTFL